MAWRQVPEVTDEMRPDAATGPQPPEAVRTLPHRARPGPTCFVKYRRKPELKGRDRLDQRRASRPVPPAYGNRYSIKHAGTSVYKYLLIIKIESIFSPLHLVEKSHITQKG